jgi:predicted TIM-barrel fold metal-dependent hydrolase
MKNCFEVFDAHSHIGEWGSWKMKGNRVDPFNREFTNKEELKAYMENYGVDRQIVMPHYHPDLSKTFSLNRKAVEMAEVEGVHAAVFFEPSHPEESRKAFEIARSEEGVKALKTSAGAWRNSDYSPGSWSSGERKVVEEALQLSAENDVPVQFHTGHSHSDPRKLFEIVDEYTEAVYHMVHSGGIAGGHFALLPRLLERIDTHKIYCDTSWSRGFAPRWFYRKLSEKDSLERMMFGTDEPWGDFPSEFHKITGLKKEEDITKEELQMLLYDNAASLYL